VGVLDANDTWKREGSGGGDVEWQPTTRCHVEIILLEDMGSGRSRVERNEMSNIAVVGVESVVP
jgi:hypothetical protein